MTITGIFGLCSEVDELSHGVFRSGIDVVEVAGTWRDYNDWLLVLSGQRGREVLTDRHFRTVLSREHEQQHRSDLISTPYGLLLWRLEATITNDLVTLLGWLGPTPPGEHILDHLASAAGRGIPVGLSQVQHLRYTVNLVDELRDLLAFRSVVQFGIEQLTVGELVALANRCLAILRSRFDLHTSWEFKTDRALDSPAVPPTANHRRFGALDVLERSAVCWEAYWVETCGRHWSEPRRMWHNWRHPDTRYRDLGRGLDALGSRDLQRVLVSALSGPCDPALPLDGDVPVEWAFPAGRYLEARARFVSGASIGDPVPQPDHLPPPLELFRMIAECELNGLGGFFGDAVASGRADRALDPMRSYYSAILQRFRDQATHRVMIEEGIPHRPESPYGLLTLFDEVCILSPTHIGSRQPTRPEVAVLVVQAMVEYATQHAVQNLLAGDAPVTETLVSQLRKLSTRLTNDLNDELPAALRGVASDDLVVSVLGVLAARHLWAP